MPVAGPVGLGSASFCDAEETCMIVGVDSDWVVSSGFPDVILTSALKGLDTAVFNTINNIVTLGALGNPYVGTLDNGGVGLADVAGADQALLDRLAELKAGIIAGTINPLAPPAS
jgi:basic membrane protein A